MCVTVRWFNDEKTIIHQIHESTWTFEEYLEAVRVRDELLRTVSNRVYVMIEFTDDSVQPTEFLKGIRDLNRTPAENECGGVIVTKQSLVRLTFNIHLRLFPERMKQCALVPTVDDALKVIETAYANAISPARAALTLSKNGNGHANGDYQAAEYVYQSRDFSKQEERD